MTGYEELTPEQIIYLAKMALAVVTVIMIGKVIPAILHFKIMKYLEVKITTKQCEERDTPFKQFIKWIKERKSKKENYYWERYRK